LITLEKIPPSMKAVVLEKPRTLACRQIPTWPLESYGDPDLVLVKVAACGVCGSDLRYYAGENPWAQHTLGRFIENPPNIVLGHEIAGDVVAVQDSKNARWLGKRVAVLCSKTCGVCPDCIGGRSHLCPNTIHLGHGQGWGKQAFYPGAYAEYVPSWAQGCFEIPADVGYGEAAMMDILAVAVHVARRGAIEPGRPVLVMGAGPAGNSIAQAAKCLGANRVAVTDRMDTPLEVSRRQGIDGVVDVRGKSEDDLAEELRRWAGEGYGSVFDSVGTAESFRLALKLLGKGGTMVEMAPRDREIPFNPLWLGSERKVTTSSNFEPRDFPTALDWLEAGRFEVGAWLTDIELAAVPQIFAAIESAHGERTAFKFVVRF